MPPVRSRAWTFTINNYTDEDCKQVDALMEAPEVHRLIGGFEVGKEGTQHIQGAVVFRDTKTMSAVSKRLKRAHLLVLNGNWQSKRAICSKETNVKWAKNTVGVHGERTDWVDGIEYVRAGASTFELKTHFPAVARCKGLVQMLRQEYENETAPKWRDIHTTVLWGKTRKARTRKAMEFGGYLHDAKKKKKWCSYKGEDTLVLNEFRDSCMSAIELKHLLDWPECKLDVKWGHKFARWTKVIITSNVNPEEWYSGDDDHHTKKALKRLIHEVIEVTEPVESVPPVPPK